MISKFSVLILQDMANESGFLSLEHNGMAVRRKR